VRDFAAARAEVTFGINEDYVNDGVARLSVFDLPPALAGFAYELFALTPGRVPMSLGKFNVDAGGALLFENGAPRWSNVFVGANGLDLAREMMLVITVEPNPDFDPSSSGLFPFFVLSGQISVDRSGLKVVEW
jgi:hypothetical protein